MHAPIHIRHGPFSKSMREHMGLRSTFDVSHVISSYASSSFHFLTSGHNSGPEAPKPLLILCLMYSGADVEFPSVTICNKRHVKTHTHTHTHNNNNPAPHPNLSAALAMTTISITTISTTSTMMHRNMRPCFWLFSARTSSLTPSSILMAVAWMPVSMRSSMVPCSTTSTDRSFMICASSEIVSTIFWISRSRSSASACEKFTLCISWRLNPGSTSSVAPLSRTTMPVEEPAARPFCCSTLLRKRVSSFLNSCDSLKSAWARCRCTWCLTGASSSLTGVLPIISISALRLRNLV
mmetsp:Transcript_36405/g.81018  ORF Transcript_36405/g.81018 Transcript_36405/m.81018 type:complete len:294 (-) Transcript_36405:376-1257(-)